MCCHPRTPSAAPRRRPQRAQLRSFDANDKVTTPHGWDSRETPQVRIKPRDAGSRRDEQQAATLWHRGPTSYGPPVQIPDNWLDQWSNDPSPPPSTLSIVATAEPARPDEPLLQPLRRVPLYEAVAERLREFIADHGLAPGERLPSERELAAQLGVSRTSVRQGLTLLRVTGLIDIRHGDGIYLTHTLEDVVAPIAAQIVVENPDLVAIGEVRNALEAQAARLASLRRSRDDLTTMVQSLGDMSSDIDAGGHGIAPDRNFHRAIIDSSRSPVLQDALKRLDAGSNQIAVASLQRPGQPRRSLADHHAIFAAIDRRDTNEANRLMFAHLDVTGAFDAPL